MRRWGLCLCAAGASQAFRPHLHLKPCVICDAAEAALRAETGGACTSSPSVVAPSSTKTMPPPTLSRLRSDAAGATTGHPAAVVQASSSPFTVSLSTIEDRREGLRMWLQSFSPYSTTNEHCKAPGNSSSVLGSREDFDECYAAYLRCNDDTVERDLHGVLLDTLDEQCSRGDVPSTRRESQLSDAPPLDLESLSHIRVPTRLVLPRVDVKAAAASPAPSPSSAKSRETLVNAFEQHVCDVFSSDPKAVAKQLAFQEALLAVKDVLDRERVPFFLACGTALGARRNSCFIPYDEDVDLGILYTDLCAYSSENTTEVESIEHSFSASGLCQAQNRLYSLVNALVSTGGFLVFDVLGAVEKGFELRLMHTPTNTRIDVNLYYPPVPGSDDALVEADGPFLWASSFYEAAGQRRHQMYRYRHQPFDGELTRVPFCARTSDSDGFSIPPERYLEENYGLDWRTPKQYSYSEGLASEFKNIIAE